MQDIKLMDQFACHEIAGQKDTVLEEITLQCSVLFLKAHKNTSQKFRTAS